MSVKPKPVADPTVLSLINEKIDTLEANVINQIAGMGTHLGQRIDGLTERVGQQNGRIGKVELAHATCQAERRTEVRLTSRRQIALLGGGGISGAALLALLKWIGERLHEA